MSFREKLALKAGGLLLNGFAERAASFGAAQGGRLERLNSLLAAARASAPEYDKACAAAGIAGGLVSEAELPKLPLLGRETLRAFSGGAALASLESGGTGGAGKVETRLDLEAVAARYAALLSVLKAAGWRMGERTAAFHPVEYGYFNNLGKMLAGLRFGKIVFEFFQQYLLYRLVHNRRNIYYDGRIFSDPAAAGALLESALREDPALLITRPDALMAVLKSRRGGPFPRFNRLKAVLTVGTVLGETVRREAEERFGAQVFNMYASTELGYAALSCRHSGDWLHLDEGRHLAEEAGGELVVTDLDNRLMPMLRYATGDAGEARERACLCGHSGPMLKVRGRKKNFIGTAGGGLYEAEVIDRVFPSGLPFFQLDLAAGKIILPPGSAPGAAAEILGLLDLPAGSYGTDGTGNFRLPSSGKFSFLLAGGK
ncbi:MAG: hypothetical protein HY550_03970 [Elusimicrobia bacterium]|nr:hypothetical protein [Elusimicrobiota bacterium]